MSTDKNPANQDKSFTVELFYTENEQGVKEYDIHCTMAFEDTGVVENGFLADVIADESTLELTLLTTMSHKSPSMPAKTYVHHTIALGSVPFGHEEGTIKIFSMETGGGKGFQKVDKKPRSTVSTASARERV